MLLTLTVRVFSCFSIVESVLFTAQRFRMLVMISGTNDNVGAF